MLSSPGTSFRSISANGGYRLAQHDSTVHLESLYRRAGFQGLLLLIRNAVLGWNRSAFRAGREEKIKEKLQVICTCQSRRKIGLAKVRREAQKKCFLFF